MWFFLLFSFSFLYIFFSNIIIINIQQSTYYYLLLLFFGTLILNNSCVFAREDIFINWTPTWNWKYWQNISIPFIATCVYGRTYVSSIRCTCTTRMYEHTVGKTIFITQLGSVRRRCNDFELNKQDIYSVDICCSFNFFRSLVVLSYLATVSTQGTKSWNGNSILSLSFVTHFVPFTPLFLVCNIFFSEFNSFGRWFTETLVILCGHSIK